MRLSNICCTLFVNVMLCIPALAQECDSTRKASLDTSRFDVNDNGTVTDIVSGLTWMRCMVGQHWDGGKCVGTARQLSWGEAKTVDVKNVKVSGNLQGNWRLPRINELAGIVDIRCYSPRIDLSLFPDTRAAAYWTTSYVPGNPQQAFTLSFGKEGVSRRDKTEKHFVRLVAGRD